MVVWQTKATTQDAKAPSTLQKYNAILPLDPMKNNECGDGKFTN